MLGDGLFKMELVLVVVGWQVWVALVVKDVLFSWGLRLVAVGWQ